MTHTSPLFPAVRPRRLRQCDMLRDMVAETVLKPADLIQPIFMIDGEATIESAPLMPGVNRMTIDKAVEYVKSCQSAGLCAVALFPAEVKDKKCAEGREAVNPENLICRAIEAIKKAVPEIKIIGDVALDPYTDHGHDGLIDRNGYMLNDDTIDILVKQALVLARAGCDIVAPSDMTDGRVGKIRAELEKAGFQNTLILSYAVKYASALYGPFRGAVGSDGALRGDKKTYQMDFRNIKEAVTEAAADIAEGADMIMVKPGSPYSDVIYRLSQKFETPVLAYQVSGEYAGLKLAADAGAFDFKSAMLESLIGLKRAGARAIFTYAALEIAEYLQNSGRA